ncbi:MAG: DNA gyrase subunit A [Cellvibrionaceae bacterium]|jgi:DNA gyrase subunit A
MDLGTVKQIDINKEMRDSYLSYAMSVIVSRALPDVRDGLKPVQRRILYAMHDMGLISKNPHRKSARVVGEVLGKYHPHGDQSVYDAMVRMAQDFSMRYELVDGQGNFGSIDGDAAAAMRYTEARISTIGDEMLTDIEKETVDFASNFDDSLNEPTVLPAEIPNLLINGVSGIAVGMSTSIPPHNFNEVVSAIGYMIDNWDKLDDITPADLMNFIMGPDFPTAGVIFRYRESKNHESGQMDALANAYATGKGRITVRAKVHVEEMGRSKSRIVVTELPYQVNKTNLLTRIADLHRNGKLEGLTDLRDESDRTGIRIILETTRNVTVEDTLADLYRLTPLQGTFSINMVALVDGEPRVLNLKQILRYYVEHRLEIVRRRSEYDRAKAQERAHILEGLLSALDHLDEVIAIIRKSRNVDTARQNLIKRFKFSTMQTQSILDMPLRRLAALERKKIQDEFKEKKAVIKELTTLLESSTKMRAKVKEELEAVLEKYSDRRRSRIVDMLDGDVTVPKDLVPDESTWVMLGEKGTVARSTSTHIGRISGKLDEMPLLLAKANTRDLLYLLAADGKATCMPVHQLPIASEFGGGTHWAELTAFTRRNNIVGAVVIPTELFQSGEGFLTMATLGGSVKRVRVEDLPGVTSEVFPIIRIEKGDSLGWARLTLGDDDVILGTAAGQAIRFSETQIRPMGLQAGGIAGIKLKSDEDGVVAMELMRPDTMIWAITDDGLAKATSIDEFPSQGRNGQGVVCLKLPKGSMEMATLVVGDMNTRLLIKMTTGMVKPHDLNQAKIGSRSVKPISVAKIGPRSRVAGVVGFIDTGQEVERRSGENDAKQLPLIG